MSMHFRRRASCAWQLLALSAAVLCTAAQAQTTDFKLRFFEIETANPYQTTNTTGYYAADRFNDGNPLTGISYQPLYNGADNGTPISGSYSVGGAFTAGAEITGPAPDFLGQTSGIGSLAFRRGDAASFTNNLIPAGSSAYTLSLSPTVPANTAYGLVNASGSFSILSVWNFSSMAAGDTIVMGLSGTGGSNYVDRLQLRWGVDLSSNQPFINFETQSRTGFPASPVLTRSLLDSTTPQALYANLGDVDYIGLALSRDMPSAATPNPTVRATMFLFDAATDTNGDLVELARYSFATEGSTFLTPGAAFSSVFVGGTWNQIAAVPEPASWSLLLMGCGMLAVATRRRAQA